MTTVQSSGGNQKRNRIIIGLALLPAILIYAFRTLQVFLDLPLFCIFVPLIAMINFALIIKILVSRHLPTISICLLTVIFASRAPKIVPEQVHLILHRSDYLAVVELARNRQLGHAGICQYAYVLPKQYSRLSHTDDKCIFVEYDPALVVVFEPLISRLLLVYAETPQAVEKYISCGGSDGIYYYQIEPYWYRCLQDWN